MYTNCNKIYIGQTRQHLRKKIYQHRNSERKQSNSITALTKHTIDENHTFNYENRIEIWNKETNYYRGTLKEMVNVRKYNNTINFRDDVRNLGAIYNNILT